MFNTIMLATDGSEHANKALEVAVDLALKYQARLKVLHVLLHDATAVELRRSVDMKALDAETQEALSGLGAASVPRPVGSGMASAHVGHKVIEQVGRHVLDRALQYARQQGVTDVEGRLEEGGAAKRIAHVAKEESADMLVMGSRGLGAWESVLMHGSVTQQVRHLCDCCCLTVV